MDPMVTAGADNLADELSDEAIDRDTAKFCVASSVKSADD